MFTENDLIRDIRALGIKNDDLLTVHTSLKAIGEIDGNGKSGAHTVICALRACVPNGILMIPAHTYSNIREVPIFNIRETMPCIGTLPKIAVELANEAYDNGDSSCVRSMQVSHSVVAFGKNAYDFVACDRHVRTRTPMAGCYGKLYYEGGKILLLGVGLNKNTYIHSIDEHFDYNINGHIDTKIHSALAVTVTDYDGKTWVQEEISTPGPDAASFVRYKDALDAAGAIKYGKIGNADSMLIDAKKCFDVVMETRTNEINIRS